MTLGALDDRALARQSQSRASSGTLAALCAETGYRVAVTSLFPSPEVVHQWRDLATRALGPNLFYEPEFAQAASIPFGKDVQLLTIWTNDQRPGLTIGVVAEALHLSEAQVRLLTPDIGAQYFRDVAVVINAGGPPDKAKLVEVMSRYGLVPAAPMPAPIA